MLPTLHIFLFKKRKLRKCRNWNFLQYYEKIILLWLNFGSFCDMCNS
jgi:hypothetical protein